MHSSLRHCTEVKNLKTKYSVKILGVLFTYDYHPKRRSNFDEVITSIEQKLRIWRWRDLTIIGRIQIVKTYRPSMICLDQKIVKEVYKIIFDFIWVGDYLGWTSISFRRQYSQFTSFYGIIVCKSYLASRNILKNVLVLFLIWHVS